MSESNMVSRLLARLMGRDTKPASTEPASRPTVLPKGGSATAPPKVYQPCNDILRVMGEIVAKYLTDSPSGQSPVTRVTVDLMKRSTIVVEFHPEMPWESREAIAEDVAKMASPFRVEFGLHKPDGPHPAILQAKADALIRKWMSLESKSAPWITRIAVDLPRRVITVGIDPGILSHSEWWSHNLIRDIYQEAQPEPVEFSFRNPGKALAGD